ncbi:MAG: hypothetical protein COX07_06910 [Bacteroidetes bacterium CG23_combo_of_CG06-09_8_20_14_all_32_9]|nr:MAG: hypothetical protein COX07_06910 [Bacteroidetes bacterium CG23_combo_of_CG06-09_8_20_14_all_32_9]
MIRIFIFFALILPSKQLFTQNFMENIAFQSGEKISYNIMYNLGFIWVNAGKVDFSVDSTQFQNKPAYIFRSSGTSYSSYDWIFKVREVYISYTKCSPLVPLKYARKSIEGDYFANEIYEFDYQNNKIYTQIENSKTNLSRDTFVLKPNTLDLLTAIYVCRNINFSQYNVGTKIPLLVLLDNKYEPLYIRFLGSDFFKNHNGKKYKCLKFSVSLVSGTIFNVGENMTIVVTDDNKHLPVYIEADILVGSVKAFISSYNILK